ncbi:Prophage CP4-57 integrase [compost metagenome]
MSTPSKKPITTDAHVRSLNEPGRYNVPGSPGLYVQVSKAGGKLWRLKYRLHGKENLFAIGVYPAVSLKRAREMAEEARVSIAQGIPPLKAKTARIEAQRAEQARTFQHIADQWLALKAPKLVEKSLSGFKGALANHINPLIGRMPVSEIKLEHVSAVLAALSGQGKLAMAKRCRTIIRAVLGFAVGREWVPRNVALGRSDELEIRHAVTHAAAIERPDELARYLCKLDVAGDGVVTQALRLLTLIPARPGELCAARWEDIDFIGADWRYVVSKTERLSSEKHIAVLSTQALDILRELHNHRVVNSKGQGWVFPSLVHPGQPINPTSLLKAAQRLWPERKMSAHGFRSTFRTLAHEALSIDWVVLELMLSHRMPGPHGATYARSQLLEQRRETAQRWAAYLDRLRATAEGSTD